MSGATAPRHGRERSTHACRLRRKLGAAGAIGYVVNTRGVGYRLVDRLPHSDGEARRAAERGGEAAQRLGAAA